MDSTNVGEERNHVAGGINKSPRLYSTSDRQQSHAVVCQGRKQNYLDPSH